MFDSILVGMSGLSTYSRGLKIISNNVTNMNTVGYKGAKLNFSNFVSQQGAGNGGGDGLTMLPPTSNFLAGQTQQTNNPLDAAISGNGFFVLRQDAATHFTRAGQFQFDKNGYLVSTLSGFRVAGYDQSGKLSDITLNGLRLNPPKATATVKLSGNLDTTATSDFTVGNVALIDTSGAQQIVSLVFKNNSSTTPGSWTVTVKDSSGTQMAQGDIKFTSGAIDPTANSLNVTLSPSGTASSSVTLDLSTDVTSFASGGTSTLSVSSVDGYTGGSLTSVTFDADGNLVTKYSNGQTTKGARLAIAQISTPQALQEVAHSEFIGDSSVSVELSRPNVGSAGSIQSGYLEMSNVEISAEFSNLIIVQRGYQASSRVVSTANQMLQDLYDLKGLR